MTGVTNTTAGVIRAILAIIDPEQTPKIAWKRDELALPLINKLKESVGDRDGSLRASIWWNDEDAEIQKELAGICGNMSEIFSSLHSIFQGK